MDNGDIWTIIGSLGGLQIVLAGFLYTRSNRVEDKVEALGNSVHADFIEHLRREHKMGDST